MNSITLEEILKSKLENYSNGNGFYGLASFVNQDQINLVLEAMRDACNQAIDLCSNNAITIFYCNPFDYLDEGTTEVDTDSILNTKKQIV